jgi:hypothetical protein
MSRLPAFFILFIFFALMTFQEAQAREETAHLTLKKTAVVSDRSSVYIVRHGDNLSNILKTRLGGTAGSASQNLMTIRRLNPDIKDLNRIYPGQSIKLPGAIMPAEGRDYQDYNVKTGDSLWAIIEAQLGVAATEIGKTLRHILHLNPGIKDINRIYPGQIIKLPKREREETSSPAAPVEPREETPAAVTAVPSFQLSNRELSVIRYVIGLTGGSVVTNGNYYFPLSATDQLVINCATVPVIEMKDGTRAVMDFLDQVPEDVKKQFNRIWSNFIVISEAGTDGVFSVLETAINHSKTYSFNKAGKSLSLGKEPEVRIFPGWVLAKKAADGSEQNLYGLSLIDQRSQPLPVKIAGYAEKNGFPIVELNDQFEKVNGIDDGPSSPEIKVLAPGGLVEMADSLLRFLGYVPVKGSWVKIFDPGKDGFQLSIKAELMIHTGDHALLYVEKELPRQFIDILKKDGTKTIIISEKTQRKELVEKTLEALNLPFSVGKFEFPSSGRAKRDRWQILLPAIKLAGDRNSFYLVDFDMDRQLYELLHKRWGIQLVRY